ncbi:MAG: HlyD family efflux transporter periplasmic adaptor subunit [Firmicutes bacterium]|nr:HlyD family efflux transporter periplasmic adaptor subunit [Bacillota bacterium]
MRKIWIILLVLVVVGVAGLLLLRGKWNTSSQPANAVNQPTAAEADAPTETPQERASIEAFGVVKATNVININIDFSARVRELYVKEGQKVTLGEPLLALDVDEYRNQIRDVEYELLVAKFDLKKAEKDLKKTETELTQLAAEITKKETALLTNTDYELNQLQADLAKAQQDLETKRELAKINGVSQQEVAALEKTVADLNRSLQSQRQKKVDEIEKLKAELALKQINKDLPGAELTALNMQKEKITLLENKLAMLRKKLDQNFIRNNQIISNVKNGIVVELGYTEGDLLTPEKKVLSIIDLDSLIVEANIAEEFIKDLQIGAGVVITPVADYDRTYRGKVIRRSAVAIKENGETVIPVEISIDDRNDFLLPNFNVDVKIYIDETDSKAPAVPGEDSPHRGDSTGLMAEEK